MITWDSVLSISVGIFSIILAFYTLYRTEIAETRMNKTFNSTNVILNQIKKDTGMLEQCIERTQQQHINLIGQISSEHDKTIRMFFKENRKGTDTSEK